MSDWKKLRQLAEAATPGPWEYDHANVEPSDGRLGAIINEDGARAHDSKFIAAANPTTILALLDEIERLTLQLTATEEGAYNDAVHLRGVNKELRDQLATITAEHDSLRAEAGRLRAERNGLHDALTATQKTCVLRDEQLSAALAAKEEACDAAIAFRDGLPVTVSIATLRSIGKDGGND